MTTYIRSFVQWLSHLENRFDRHFGWFFTNGMKERQQHDRVRAKARLTE